MIQKLEHYNNYPIQLKHGISASKVQAQLYSTFLLSLIETQLLSTGLGIKLYLPSVLEMRILHTLTLTVGDWPFGITVTKHVRPKLDHSIKRKIAWIIQMIVNQSIGH